ncbi:hypothetical protein [Clavibacter sp. VKM Ac-2872]|uniref:hypothetical protein n=1 Tax=Clavibacter sp. VKM Ac-2872 TaxID=2783812 RepID=UPI00188C4046|nr:hypothetical protein [Clavibacter sp. VKM Ac-2872]MBF4623086.1 hypothetical protein [Clavibacter sp. VKM Ac-2872]
MSASNEETLTRLTSIIDGLESTTPSGRRHELLKAGNDGYSVVDSARRVHASSENDINGALEPTVEGRSAS